MSLELYKDQFCYGYDFLKNHLIAQKPSAKLAILGSAASWLTLRWLVGVLRRRQTWKRVQKKQKAVKNKKAALEEELKVDGELLTDERNYILSLGIIELLEKLKNNELRPLVVLQAYQAKSLLVDKEINAICEYITEATAWARQLEEVPLDKRGPLYGLPISIKECFFIKGYDSTLGLVNLVGNPAPEDAEILRALKDFHALPFCITNVPQMMLSIGCSNPIYGWTNNPHCLERSPGGSSGGEAALLAAGGSILGLGSDIGGSVRKFIQSRKLRFGWYDVDAYFPVTPGCRRAVHQVVDLLRQDGHTVSKFDPPNLTRLADLAMEFLFADQGQTTFLSWKGEILDPNATMLRNFIYRLPYSARKWIVAPVARQFSRIANVELLAGLGTAADLWRFNGEKHQLTYQFMEEWDKAGVDIIIGPGLSFPSTPTRWTALSTMGASATIVYNVIGCPAGTVTVTKETAQDQEDLKSYPVHQDLYHRAIAHVTKGAEGMPMAVQVIGRHWQDEMVLHAMSLVENLVDKQKRE